MATVKEGDTIRIHYTGKLEDGTIFDSSQGTNPLEFTVGGGDLIAGLEAGVVGMASGESKTITIPAEQAYGPHIKEKVFEFDKKKAPENFNPEVGERIQMYRADGLPLMARVAGISETAFTMDCNHPLAGKTLIFDTTIVEIV